MLQTARFKSSFYEFFLKIKRDTELVIRSDLALRTFTIFYAAAPKLIISKMLPLYDFTIQFLLTFWEKLTIQHKFNLLPLNSQLLILFEKITYQKAPMKNALDRVHRLYLCDVGNWYIRSNISTSVKLYGLLFHNQFRKIYNYFST